MSRPRIPCGLEETVTQIGKVRDLCIVLGDQLNADSTIFEEFDDAQDIIWMAETHEETTHVWAHKARVAFFLSAMRHFREELRRAGRRVEYVELADSPRKDCGVSHQELLERAVDKLRPNRLRVVLPGDWRVLEQIKACSTAAGVPLEILPDDHFYCQVSDFREWAGSRKELVLEHFYRWLRKREGILMTSEGKPLGSEWNFDQENRSPFGKQGPGRIPPPPAFPPDEISLDVLRLIERRFADRPGKAEMFQLPVTRRDALRALRDFVRRRLPLFGKHQDAMWEGEPFLFHSMLSAPLNVKLLNPRECVDSAVSAFMQGAAPIESVEGFVRQIMGWREFVRGIYWTHMPEYLEMNALDHHEPLPGLYWDGDTDMSCVRDSMRNVIEYGYSHHIQRLMVLGLFAQLLGVHPKRFHEWHTAMYVDAVDWVSAPNALGMSQYGDGGIVGSKPYCASGKYIDRMSNHCSTCQYNVNQSSGANACPFNVLYWDFLARHQNRFADNRRMKFQIANLFRKSAREISEIRMQAESIREFYRSRTNNSGSAANP